jgi:hypothetical protein
LERAVATAPVVPTTAEKRLDRRWMLARADQLRTASDTEGNAFLRDGAERLTVLLRDARPVPLTGQVRVDEGVVTELLGELRSANSR